MKEFAATKEEAEVGDSMAQFYLASMYSDGEGVEQSSGEAGKWYRKAAEQGMPEAQYALGEMYEDGEVVNQSYKEAVKWFLKCAEQGYRTAQFALGQMCRDGKGVSEDKATAYAWMYIAVGTECDGAEKEIVWLAQEMTPDQIAKGQKLSREMIKKNPKILEWKQFFSGQEV